ncbi:MAG: hypothetical protein IKO26_09890 [Paludibacteraceae bacterium]|nr:hypothetical protein [Paludibacteraceae bacterium]
MKTRFTWLGIIAACILGISAVFISCENGVNAIVQYEGKVVHKGTTSPYPDLEVKITNGDKIHTVDHTDKNGNFTLNVKIDEIDGSYYVLVGDSSCITKRMELSSYGLEKVNLGTIEIEGPSLPTVSTKTISDISDNKATSGGNVTADGRSSVTARGVCWSKSEYPTIDDEHTQNGSGLGEFKSQITNIEAGTTYYVRAYATNRMGTVYGEQFEFTSLNGLANVITDSAFAVTSTSLVIGGNITDDGGYPIIERGICYSDIISEPTIYDNKVVRGKGKGEFSAPITGLSPSTTYYFRAYAINEKGEAYGNTQTVLTKNGLPIVDAKVISYGGIFDFDKIGFSSLFYTIQGNVIDNGGSEITARGICFSDQPYPTVSNSSVVNADIGEGYYSCKTGEITSFSRVLYIRAYASNTKGTSYSNQIEISPQRMNYDALPMLEYGGYMYKFYDMKGTMTWQNANKACEELEYGGYSDWTLPEKEELYYFLNTFNLSNLKYWSCSTETKYCTDDICSLYYRVWISGVYLYLLENPSEAYNVIAIRKYSK